MIKNVYVVRHCKANGQEPQTSLTELGMQQAEILAELFLDKDIDFIISSPFVRAYRTIAPLAEKLGIEVVLDNRLAERVLSSKNHPKWHDMLRKTYDNLDLCYEGGESSRAAMERALHVVEDVLNTAYKNIILVSHGNLISLLLKHFDDRIGFMEWEALSNPDVFHFSFAVKERPHIRRIWID